MIQLVKQYKDEGEGEDTWDASVAEQIGEEDEAMKLYDLYLSSRPTVPSSSIHTELDLYLEEACPFLPNDEPPRFGAALASSSA